MSARKEKHTCECYKRLSSLGIPMYKRDESYDYGEERVERDEEKAFPVPRRIKIDETCMGYPVVGDTDLSTVFEYMSQVIIGVSDFEVNVLSFWILDVFVEGLWTAQNAGMGHEHQKATLLWIGYLFNYILKRNPSRKEVFRHLKEILFLPEAYDSEENWRCSFQSTGKPGSPDERRLNRKGEPEYEAGGSWQGLLANNEAVWPLPLPPVVEESRDGDDVSSKSSQRVAHIGMNGSLSVSLNQCQSHRADNGEWLFFLIVFEGGLKLDKVSVGNWSGTRPSPAESTSELNATHMIVILEILYRIFGRLWVYLEMQSSLHSMPKVEIVELPLKIHTPKVKAPPKGQAGKSGKRGPVGGKSGEETEAEREAHKNDYILPLEESDEAKTLALVLFGPPPGDKKGKGEKTK